MTDTMKINLAIAFVLNHSKKMVIGALVAKSEKNKSIVHVKVRRNDSGELAFFHIVLYQDEGVMYLRYKSKTLISELIKHYKVAAKILQRINEQKEEESKMDRVAEAYTYI